MSEAIHHPVVPEFICEYHSTVSDVEGREYRARVYGIAQGQKIWDAWIVFFPEGGGPMRRTDVECEQGSRAALAIWAARLTPAYLALALERSHPFRETGASAPEHVSAAPV